jgi:hypothetical protein
MKRKIKRGFSIYQTLKALSKQRVGLILQPGNVWVIERAVPDDEKTEANLRTCYLRGWVEPIENAIPKGRLTVDGKLPEGSLFSNIGPLYRLTDSGWNAIHRTHEMAFLGVSASLIAVGVGVIAICL